MTMAGKHSDSFFTRRGMTLIEMSIVVAVAGLILASSADAVKIWHAKYANDQVSERMTAIHAAIASYVAEKGHLPCPASYNAKQGDADFGKAADCNNPVPLPASAPLRTAASPGRPGMVRIGAVPVRDLNLPSVYMADSRGKKFTYAVTEDLANTTLAYDESKGGIDAVDAAGVTLLGTAGEALYTLVSHGSDGVGAYTYDGGILAQACPADVTQGQDQENCNDDAKFLQMLVSTTVGADHFDDIVTYKTKIDDTGSAEIQKIADCAATQKLYSPMAPGADVNGCINITAGDLVNKIAFCSAILKFYSPATPGADANGCANGSTPTALTRMLVCNNTYRFYNPLSVVADLNGCVKASQALVFDP